MSDDKYKFHRDLWFKNETPLRVCDVLASSYARQKRIRIWYGDIETGVAWAEEHDVVGTIGRSTGPRKVPLLLYRSNTGGGPAVLDHCIVRIDEVDSKWAAYKHPLFSNPADSYAIVTKQEVDGDQLVDKEWLVVNQAGSAQARFTKKLTAERWLDFMRGRRYSK